MKLLSLFCEIDVMFGFRGTTLYVGPTEDYGIEEGLIIPASELEAVLSAIESFGFDRDMVDIEEVDEENDDVYLPDFWLKGE